MRFGSPGGRRRQPAEINVTSLVDVIFNLLLFFMLTTSFSESAGLEVQLPSASAADVRVQADDLVVVLTRDGHTLVNGESMSPSALDEKMNALKEGAPRASVIVQADTEVPHGRVVGVIDAAKKAGVRTVSIATEGD